MHGTLKKENVDLDLIKILLVDDLDGNLLALEGLLRRDDLEIFKAKSGGEALEFMIIHDFAVALVDVQMPNMSGFELAELMRGAKKTKDIPIIFVTATAKHQTFMFKGYESGAVDFLPKPLDTHAVKSKVSIFVELYRQKKELKKIQVELEQAVQIRDDFMSIASHELKTPLSSLKFQTQFRQRILQKNDPSVFSVERLQKMFNDDEKQIDRITHLIDDMLDVSRISSGKLSMNFEKFDLGELVHDIVERNSELLAAAGCQTTIEVSQPTIGNWDRFRIEQVVTNFLTNGLRYGPEKPIEIKIYVEAEHAVLVVKDHGMGIADEDLKRIFQRFERVKGSSMSGLGLGLYIVSQIIESHHGSIKVESVLGEGSSFMIKLPLNSDYTVEPLASK